MKRRVIPVLAWVVLCACQEPTTPPDVPPGPQLEIVDAFHNGGNERFQFLPPIVPERSLGGTFDGSLLDHLTVRICEVNGGECLLPAVAEFTSTDGSGSERVRLDPEEELYGLSLHTDEFDLDSGETYRIQVLVAGTELGHADIDVVGSGNELKNVDTGESIALKDGRTFPIKFRIHRGAVSVVDASGGMVIGGDGRVSLAVPAGAVDEAIGITVEAAADQVTDEVGLLSGTVFDIGPSGTLFNQLVDLTLRYDEAQLPAGVDESELALMRLAEDGLWDVIDQSSVDPDANTVSAPIGGLSRWGLGCLVGGEVSPAAVTLEPGEVVGLSVEVTCGLNPVLGRRLTWNSTDGSVVSVNPPNTGTAVDVTATGAGVASVEVTVPLCGWGLAALPSPIVCYALPMFIASAEITVTGGGLRYASLDAGGSLVTCGVTTSDEAYCWGWPGTVGGGSTLGRGIAAQDVTNNDRPGLVVGGYSFTHVRTGGIVCGLASAGARCWGGSSFTGVGDGTGNPSAAPVALDLGLAFTSVDGGGSHACGVVAGGDAYCWGNGSGGRLGTGNANQSDSPVLVVGGHVFESVSAGFGPHTCGITTTDDAYCWGLGQEGQLGNGQSGSQYQSTVPVLVAGNHTWASVSAGDSHNCGLTTDGVAYCWGNGFRGKLGTGFGTNSDVPVPVSGGMTFASISAGGLHTCGVTTDGDAYCWGAGSLHPGSIGDGSAQDRYVPTLVAGGLTWESVTAGSTHSCGITAGDGAAYCWGLNDYGQLGTGTQGTVSHSLVPVRVVDPSP